MIVTKKIEVYVDCDDKEVKKSHYDKLFQWSNIIRNAANILSSNLFVMDNIKNMIYLDEGIRVKLVNILKDKDGILSTSYQNSGYQLLSKLFKGEIPMDIISNLNSNIQKTYKEEKTDYYKGNKSLRSYGKNIPMPFSSRLVEFTECEKNYTFSFFKIPFKTRMGYDKSSNFITINRINAGEYKLCNSSLKYDDRKNKWFLLLCVDIPNTRLQAKPGLRVESKLGLLVPIIAECEGDILNIGNDHEYLYQRLQIQSKLKSLQKDLKYAVGGKGRKGKLQAIERFKEKETNYIKSKIHLYSRMLINYAIKKRAEFIVLLNQEGKEQEAKENEFLLRNWGYYGLIEFIKYKAAKVGITVIME